MIVRNPFCPWLLLSLVAHSVVCLSLLCVETRTQSGNTVKATTLRVSLNTPSAQKERESVPKHQALDSTSAIIHTVEHSQPEEEQKRPEEKQQPERQVQALQRPTESPANPQPVQAIAQQPIAQQLVAQQPMSEAIDALEQPASTGESQPFQQWLTSLQQSINTNKDYPFQARRRRLSGDVEIEMEISPGGTLVNARVIQGAKVFHKSILRAVHASFPRPPTGSRKPITVHLAVHYRLR